MFLLTKLLRPPFNFCDILDGSGDRQDIKQVRMEDVKHRGCLIF